MQTATQQRRHLRVIEGHPGIFERVDAAKRALRVVARAGNQSAICKMADEVRQLSRIMVNDEIDDIIAAERNPLATALAAAGIPPVLVLKDLTIPVDDESAITSLSTDGDVAMCVDMTVKQKWAAATAKIRATGRCPRCESTTITETTERAGSIGAVPVFACFECSYEVPVDG